MSKLYIFLLLLTISNNVQALSSNDYIRKGQLAESQLQEVTALELYKKAIQLNPNNETALSKAALLYSNIGSRMANNDKKLIYYKKALKLGSKSFNLKPTSSNANFVMAVIHGREVFMTALPKAKIRWSAKMKKYADRAVKLNPKNKDAWALLGFWHYERATLTNIEKRFVNLLGGLPEGSLKQSMYCLNKCTKLDHTHILNLLTLGKVYKSLGQKQTAITFWQRALTSKSQCYSDNIYKQEAKKRLGNI